MFTLVRHNMWTIDRFPRFHRGLEPLEVGLAEAMLARYLGGVLLRTETEAWDAAEGFMYPDGDMTLMAHPSGSFLETPVFRQPLFIPQFSGDLIAA